MPKIVFLTSDFPYRKTEAFIEAEMNALPPHLSVDILPTRLIVTDGDDPTTHRPLPDNAHLHNDLHKKLGKLPLALYCLRSLFMRSFYAELGALFSRKKLSLATFARTLSTCARAEHMYCVLKKKYSRELRQHNIVFYSYWFLIPALAAARLSERFGVPAVSRAHGYDLYEERNATGTLPFRSYLANHLTAIRPCSMQGEQYLLGRTQNHSAEIRHAYLGTVDHGPRAVSSLPPPTEPFIIASCSALKPLKRVWLIADVLCHITERPIKWIHFGSGPQEDIEKVLSSCRALPDNVSFELAGAVDNARLLEYYKNNDIHLFINISTHEGLPVSLMEAISFGIPIIATDVGGSREITQPEFGTLLTSTYDDTLIKEAADAILRFISMTDDEYEHRRIAARTFWEQHFKASKNHSEFYDELCQLVDHK